MDVIAEMLKRWDEIKPALECLAKDLEYLGELRFEWEDEMLETVKRALATYYPSKGDPPMQ